MVDNSIAAKEARDITKVAAGLLNDLHNDRNRIPVKLFKSAGLPLLLSTHPEAEIDAWVSIAGNPQKAVDVVDESGKVLYTVPPIINTRMVGKLDPFKGKGIDLALTENLEKLRSGHYPPRKSKELVLDTVSPLLNMVITDPKALEQWNLVLKANGIKEVGVVNAQTGKPATSAEQEQIWTIFTDEIEE